MAEPMTSTKRTNSFLLRVWLEPTEKGVSDSVRGYLRNLQAGEEQYIADPEALTTVIRGQVRSQSSEADENGTALPDSDREVTRRATGA